MFVKLHSQAFTHLAHRRERFSTAPCTCCPQSAQGGQAVVASLVHRRTGDASIARVDSTADGGRTLRRVTVERDAGAPNTTRATRRTCARRGCMAPVKKATAKYCSVRCCSLDPERHARLRLSAQRSNRRVLPMTRQLNLGFSSANNPEAAISRISEAREDVPRGMSRLRS